MTKISEKRRVFLKSIAPVGALASLASVGLLSACGGGTVGDSAANGANGGGGVTPSKFAENAFSTTADNQADTFKNLDQIEVTRVVRKGVTRDLPQSSYQDRMQASDALLTEFMHDNRTAGVLLLKNGEIALERYGMGCDQQSKWTSFSIASSIMSTLTGAAERDGYLTVADRLTAHLPQLNGTAYESLYIHDLLRMTSAVAWDDPVLKNDDIVALHAAARQHKSGAVMDFLTKMPRNTSIPPGSPFEYNPGNSHVLGALLRAASGQPLNDYLSAKIWQPAGMEADASWWSETADDGSEIGCGGISATLRDYGRFGQFILDQMQTPTILPADWSARAYLPGGDGRGYDGPDVPRTAYGYNWWVVDPHDVGWPLDKPVFFARGMYGQYVFVDPAYHSVLVVLSAWRDRMDFHNEDRIFTLAGRYLTLVQE